MDQKSRRRVKRSNSRELSQILEIVPPSLEYKSTISSADMMVPPTVVNKMVSPVLEI
jgi:hypothetical protein